MAHVCLPYAEELASGKVQNFMDNVLLCRTAVMIINSAMYFTSLIALIMTTRFLDGDLHKFMTEIIKLNKEAKGEFNSMAFWSTFMLVLIIGTFIYQLGNLFSLYNRNYKMMHHTLRLGVLLCVCYFITASILLKYCSYTMLWEKVFAASVPNYFSTNKTLHHDFLDHVQRSFFCCGFKGPEDYKDAVRNLLKTKSVQCFSNNQEKAGILLVPVTCCQGNQCNIETCRDNNKEVYAEVKNTTFTWMNVAAEACGTNETDSLFVKRKTFARLSSSRGCEVPINEATCDFLLRLGVLSIALWFCFLLHMQAVRYTRCCLQAKEKYRDEGSKEGERKKNSETIADFENQKRPIASLRSLIHGLSTLSGVPSLPEVKCEKRHSQQ